MRYGVPRETSLCKGRVTDKFDFPSLSSAFRGAIWLLCARVPVPSVRLDCRLEVESIPDFVAARAVKRRTRSERSGNEALTASSRGYRSLHAQLSPSEPGHRRSCSFRPVPGRRRLPVGPLSQRQWAVNGAFASHARPRCGSVRAADRRQTGALVGSDQGALPPRGRVTPGDPMLAAYHQVE